MLQLRLVRRVRSLLGYLQSLPLFAGRQRERSRNAEARPRFRWHWREQRRSL